MQKKKRGFKYLVNQIHLWLGLVSGTIVFIVAVTGCLFAFQKEISELLHKNKLFVDVPAAAKTMPLSALLPKAQHALGDSMVISNITTYKQPDRSWEFMVYEAGDPEALTIMGGIKHYCSVHINPYTGVVTGKTDYKTDFFVIVKNLHWSLLLNTPYGQPIVGWATFIFVVLLITGLVLWWPKKWNRHIRKQRFSIKWDAKWRRLNYDLHSVLGVYGMLITLVLALTGMVWAFEWFNKAVYTVAAGTSKHPEQKAFTSVKGTVLQTNPLDIAFSHAQQARPEADRIGVSPAYGEEGLIYMYCYRGKEVYYDYDALQYDQYSGKLLHTENRSSRNRGEVLTGMNYDIHVGAIAGLPGKILAFMASLIAASLPVTGVLLWWGKRHKPSHKAAV
ncbi:putative iron-regulated membrane protein [Filimonas zeae]|uniref:Membrane protein n=1 Tax=Filimonas zeae TaxID=1737353 RepID=A0A917MS51_9BACT|nr:PepSY-associated TM helix domain-containing protein [Filimonas zeae]MDR6337755.1 putative iron-regulated membrane protein [Filimonas zeae]GGH60119.1 membrane protein [Filimonas zeae]